MAFVAKTACNPMSVATNGCLVSSPSLFAPSNISYKPMALQLYCKPMSSFSVTSSFSLKKEALFRISVVAEQGYEGNLSWDASGVEEEDGDGAEGGYVQPPEGAKVYVGNLPFDVDHDSLAQLFQQAGVIEIAEVIYDRMTGRSRGFGFVTMNSVEEAERAVEMFNRYDLGGRLLTVNIAAPKGSRPERAPREPGYRIYVGNISWNVDSSQLEDMFCEYGKVLSARIVSDRETGRSRGFGFVEMSTESEMNNAIANLDGVDLDGRTIKVNAAEERPRRSPF